MGWLIFWGIVGAWALIGFKRIPVYYKRCDEHNAKEYPYSYKDGGMTKSNAWGAIALAVFCPFYETGRWFQNYIIRTATAEQRKWDEYVKAEQIVEAYKKQKEREEHAKFDKAMKKLEW